MNQSILDLARENCVKTSSNTGFCFYFSEGTLESFAAAIREQTIDECAAIWYGDDVTSKTINRCIKALKEPK